MGLQDYLALATFGLAIAGIVFALGKQASDLIYIKHEIKEKFPKHAAFLLRLDRRVTEIERKQLSEDSHQNNDIDLEI